MSQKRLHSYCHLHLLCHLLIIKQLNFENKVVVSSYCLWAMITFVQNPHLVICIVFQKVRSHQNSNWVGGISNTQFFWLLLNDLFPAWGNTNDLGWKRLEQTDAFFVYVSNRILRKTVSTRSYQAFFPLSWSIYTALHFDLTYWKNWMISAAIPQTEEFCH